MITALDTTILRRACEIADRNLSGVGDGQLASPTPCSEWTVADVMQHIVGATDYFADVAERGASPQREWPDYPPAEFVPSFRRHAERLLAGFDAPGAMGRPMLVLSGPTTGEVAIQVAIGELFVHSWDLARATGQAFGDEDIADALLLSDYIALCADVRDDATVPFAAIVRHGANDPPMDQLVAFLGRSPQWAPALPAQGGDR